MQSKPEAKSAGKAPRRAALACVGKTGGLCYNGKNAPAGGSTRGRGKNTERAYETLQDRRRRRKKDHLSAGRLTVLRSMLRTEPAAKLMELCEAMPPATPLLRQRATTP